jgi:hypothetical protein
MSSAQVQMQLEWNEYTAAYFNLATLWAPKPAPMFASFAVTGLLTSPFLKYRHGPIRHHMERLPPAPIFQATATLIKFGASVKLTVIVERERLVLERTDRVRELKLNALKTVSRKNVGVEIATIDGRLFLLDFGQKRADAFISALAQLGVEAARLDLELANLLIAWKRRTITAFRYLTRLNHLKGRSLCNEDFYPVFPLPLVDGKVRDFGAHPAVDVKTSDWTLFFPPFQPYVSRQLPPERFPQLFASRTELSIEFFSFFECFDGLALPDCFDNAFDLVYELRGLLESDAIADALHLWVSGAFSCGFPRRPSQAVVADAFSVDLPDFRIVAYSNSAFRVLQNEGAVLSVSLGEETRCRRLPLAVTRFFAHDSAIVAIGDRRLQFSVNGADTFREVPLDFAIDRIEQCEELLAIWTKTHEVVVIRVPIIIARFSLKTDSAISLYASAVYNRVVVGVRSGRVFFFALHGGRLVNAVDFDGIIPLKVIITVGFGFVMIAFHGKITVFTINGTKIREREFGHIVVEWCAFVNRRGFDFVLIATTEGKVIVVEAFTLKESPILFQCYPVVALLRYDTPKRALIVATPDGCGHGVPCDPRETLAKF